MNFKKRDLLELAAKPITGIQDGFTNRPYPVGKVNTTKNQLIKFGKFLSRNLVAFPFQEKEGIFLVLNSSGKLFMRKPNIEKDTFVSIDFDGNISVNITQKDYNKYKDYLSFDELCISFGNVFKQFLEYYNSGQSDKIISSLESK